MKSPAALFCVALVLSGCKTKEERFFETTFACDTSLPDSQCGTTRSGAAMTCFPARQLGARDFCTERCEVESEHASAAASVCLASRSLLATCRPSAAPGGEGACNAGLACYRTDLLRDEGVCLAIQGCSTDSDCTDPVRSTCFGTLARATFPQAPFQTDRLHCLQANCKARGTACPPGETCLPLIVPAAHVPPDMCVPHCDSNLNCPPNFFCSRKVSGPDAPAVCIPGIMGLRCSTALDCLAGDCLDTGLGFKTCNVPCARDEDCLPYFTNEGPLYCVADPAGPGRHCVSPRPLAGAPCLDASNCPTGHVCAYETVYDRSPWGECRLPCDSDGRCPIRAGIPHVCLELGQERSCYPGRFGQPCKDSAECLPKLQCLGDPEQDAGAPDAASAVDAATRLSGRGRLCTIACQTDEDCDSYPWTERGAYCEAGLCRLGSGTNGACYRNAQCRTRNCVLGGGAGNCGPRL